MKIDNFNDLRKINKRDLFQKRGDKYILKKIDKKQAVKMARLLATGFEKTDLRREPSASEYKRAQKIIKDYYQAAKDSKAKLVRPSKQNRQLYAQASGMSKKFKVYLVPVNDKETKIKIYRNKKGKKFIKQVGEFISYRDYYFQSQKALAKNPKKEGQKLLNKIKVDEEKKQIRIIVGRHLTNAIFVDEKQILIELEKYSMIYDDFEAFTRGLQVATFKNQARKAKNNGKGKKKRA